MALTDEHRVHEAANALVERGERPTIAAVRRELGGGSYTAISEAMRSWREQHEQQKTLASTVEAVPEEVRTRFDAGLSAAWQAAIEQAEQRVAAEREALREREQAIEHKVSELQELVQDLEKERDKALQAVTERNQQIEALRAERDEAQKAYQAADQQRQEADSRATAAEQRAQDLAETLEHERARASRIEALIGQSVSNGSET